jgi:hypothetical protein
MRLWKQKKHWKRRLTVFWVKAHADNLKRKSTEDEKGNQTVDALAEQPYESLMNKGTGQRGVIDQNTFTTEGAEVYIQGVRLNGNIGQQIKEQTQVEAAKRAAKTKAPQWGGGGGFKMKLSGKRCYGHVQINLLLIVDG